jgi:hypothetical protein
MDNRLLVAILVMIAFTISETISVIAQPIKDNTILVPPPNATDNGLGSNDNRIILNMNGTDVILLDHAAAFTIDKHDFLKAFAQLFENSNINY